MYNDITSKPYSYVVVDNKADTPARRQIIADIFGNCVSYNTTGDNSAMSVTKQMTKAIDLNEESARKHKKENDHSKILKRNVQKVPSLFTWTNAIGPLFKGSFEKPSAVEIFQLVGFCGVYML